MSIMYLSVVSLSLTVPPPKTPPLAPKKTLRVPGDFQKKDPPARRLSAKVVLFEIEDVTLAEIRRGSMDEALPT